MATLKFTVKTSGFDALGQKLAQASDKAELTVAEQAEKDTRPFVPARTMSMANRTKATFGENLKPLAKQAIDESKAARNSGDPVIIYPGPYSRYLYYGKLMVDPETGSAWAKKGVKKVKASPDKDLVISQATNPQAQSHWFEASKAQNLDKWLLVADKAVKNGL